MPVASVSVTPVSRAMDTSMGAMRKLSKAAQKTASCSRRAFTSAPPSCCADAPVLERSMDLLYQV